MSRGLRAVRWLPPFLLGVATATSAEIGAVLLLYSGPQMLRSLTVVLVVDCAALGLGLWSAPGPGPGLDDDVRRRWLLYFTSILAATVFAGAWSLLRHLGSTGLEQGLGLALLAALPLYASGALLGAMSAGSVSEPSVHPPRVGASAVAGATLGFAATGLSLAHVLTPASLLLTALALVSAGGLVHGAILEAGAQAASATVGDPEPPAGPDRPADPESPADPDPPAAAP
jgi:hypothetical protein